MYSTNAMSTRTGTARRCTPYLAWETRLPLLKAMIAGLRSDIYCLQEAT